MVASDTASLDGQTWMLSGVLTLYSAVQKFKTTLEFMYILLETCSNSSKMPILTITINIICTINRYNKDTR